MSGNRYEERSYEPVAAHTALVALAFEGDELHVVRDVVTLPLRIALWATRLGLHVAGQAVGAALRTTERLVDAAVPAQRGADAAVARSIRVDVVDAEPVTRPAASSAPPPAEAPPLNGKAAPAPVPEAVKRAPSPGKPAARRPAREPAPPAHVSEELEFVESFAEPGAEDSVGASVRIDEPWEGYGQMPAKAVIARLADASREELGAVELYERAHRGRQTVLAAADRRLRRATAAARRRS